VLLEHRHQKQRASTADIGEVDERSKSVGVALLSRNVSNVHHLLRLREATKRKLGAGVNDRLPLPGIAHGGRDSLPCERTGAVPLDQPHETEFGFAEAGRTSSPCV